MSVKSVYPVEVAETADDARYIPIEAGSGAVNAPAGTKKLFLDSEKDNALSAIDDVGTVTIVDELVDSPQTTQANLESTYPAASHQGLFGWVKGTTAQNGLYLSDGATWVKQLDNSGDRSALFDYAGGITYGASNMLNGTGTASHRNDADSADATPYAGVPATMFDGSTAAYWTPSNSPLPNLTYKMLDTPPNALGKFDITLGGALTANTNLRAFEIFGRTSGGSIEYIAALSASTSGTPNVSIGAGEIANSRVTLDADSANGDVITVNTGNTTQYDGYGFRLVTGGALGYCNIAEMEGFETVDATDSIDCVSSINKVQRGNQAISSSSSTTINLSATDNIVNVDATAGNATVNLPAVSTAETGKAYTIKKSDVSANTVTLDADASETIDGATTNVLTTQYDYVTVVNNGTEWSIIG